VFVKRSAIPLLTQIDDIEPLDRGKAAAHALNRDVTTNAELVFPESGPAPKNYAFSMQRQRQAHYLMAAPTNPSRLAWLCDTGLMQGMQEAYFPGGGKGLQISYFLTGLRLVEGRDFQPKRYGLISLRNLSCEAR
jgi:hypothetical protein